MIVTRGRPQRTCDKCGSLRPGEAFRVVAGRWICNWHKNYVPPEALERIPIKTFPVKPFADAKPFEPRDSYQMAEWRILELLTEGYNLNQYNIPDFASPIPIQNNTQTSYGVETAGWTCVYLYELLTENKRPAPMLAHARALLRTVADWLLTRQYVGPSTPAHVLASFGIDNSHPVWGGFAENGIVLDIVFANPVVQTGHTATAGLGLLRAYQILGDARYLAAARAAIWYCRTAQCTGLLTANFPSSDSAGANRVHYRTWAHRIFYLINGLPGTSVTPDHMYRVRDLGVLEFYVAFRAAVGDELIGSTGTGGTTEFAFSRQATISEAINDVVAFWTTGVYDNTAQAVMTGFSTSTPREEFNSYPLIKFGGVTGTGSWRLANGEATPGGGTVIFSSSMAEALRGWRTAFGDTSLVTEIFDWMMTFTSNTQLQLPAKYSDKFLYAPLYTNGDYDPTFAWADEVRVRDNGAGTPINVNGSITNGRKAYNLGTVGTLASLWSARRPAAFKNFKNQLNEPRHHTVGLGEDGRFHYLGMTGRCGFSLQPTQANGRFYIPSVAARVGLAYRESPKAFVGKGR